MGIWKPSKKLVADLESGGVRTRATVVKIARAGATSGPSAGGGDSGPESLDPIEATARLKTTIRFSQPSGEVVDVSTRLTFRAGGVPKAGETVPVIHDPSDPTRVMVDDATHLAEVSARYDVPPARVIGAGDQVFAGTPSDAGFDLAGAMAAADDARAQVDSVKQAHLQQMAELHEQGVLTDDQYAAIRAQILGY